MPTVDDPPSHSGYRCPAVIISHCTWLYFRVALSYREVENMAAERLERADVTVRNGSHLAISLTGHFRRIGERGKIVPERTFKRMAPRARTAGQRPSNERRDSTYRVCKDFSQKSRLNEWDARISGYPIQPCVVNTVNTPV